MPTLTTTLRPVTTLFQSVAGALGEPHRTVRTRCDVLQDGAGGRDVVLGYRAVHGDAADLVGPPFDEPHRPVGAGRDPPGQGAGRRDRSEEHTSELQSLMRNLYAVFCV